MHFTLHQTGVLLWLPGTVPVAQTDHDTEDMPIRLVHKLQVCMTCLLNGLPFAEWQLDEIELASIRLPAILVVDRILSC